MTMEHASDRAPTDAAEWTGVLRESSSRLASRVQAASARVPAEAVALEAMREPGWLRTASERVASAMQTPRPVIADGLLLYGLVVPRVVPVVAALSLTGRVLDLDESSTFVTLGANGSIDRFWLGARPPSPSARSARPVHAADEAGALVRALVAPMACTATATLRIGTRQLWRLVGDLVVRTVHDVVRDRERTDALAGRVLAGCGPPIAFRPRWERVATARGIVERPRSRSCCLGYQISGMAYCAGCPREQEPTRTERLAAHLDAG